MKRYKYYKTAGIAALCGLMLSACDFLDVVPGNTATIDDMYKTANMAEKTMQACYDNIPNYFHPQQFPDWTAGNDFMTGWYGDVRWFHWKSLLYDMESPSSTYYALWSQSAASYPTGVQKKDVWESIRNCYDLLNHINDVPDATQDQKNDWAGEAHFLIGYYHQIMLEYYGPIPLVKQEYSLNSSPADMKLARSPYDECVDFIAQQYDEAAKLLPAKQVDRPGQATAAAALGYKARLLLYAASPLVNGNSEYYSDFKNQDGTPLMNLTYDREKWKKAMDAAKAAIDYCEQNGYKLYGTWPTTDPTQGKNNYHFAFVGENGTFNQANLNEVLFGLGDQGTVSYDVKAIAPRMTKNRKPGYSGTGFRGYLVPSWDCISWYYTKNGLPWDDDPETKGKDPYEVVKLANGDSTALWNTNREPRFYASIGYDRGTYEIAGGTITLKCRRGEEQQNDGDDNNEYQTSNGYYCQKWVSSADSYNWTTKKYTNSKYVYPFMRLAELYLDYAEADFEYNGKLSEQSLVYLNKIRQRSGLPTFQESWAKAGGIPTGDKLRQVLHQERSIELAMEGRRFHDIRRWKIADKELMRTQASWHLDGKTAAAFYKQPLATARESGVRKFTAPKNYWLAIPLDQIQVNSKIVQNPGY